MWSGKGVRSVSAQVGTGTGAGGTVCSIQLFQQYRGPAVRRTEVVAVTDFGLEGNRRSKAGSSRQVLLLERETLDELGLAPGDLRENITTEGIDLHSLGAGSRLRIGDQVVLEITQYCAPCSRLEELREGLMREVSGRRGMLARVVTGGPIALGDPIAVIEKTEPQRSRLSS